MDGDKGNRTELDAINLLEALKKGPANVKWRELCQKDCSLRLKFMGRIMKRMGLKVEDLDRLNIIHVTGTKGKGSTCAFTEHILRGYGFRTGFFSSPHLVHYNERIRLNGKPMDKELFFKYFWQIYGQLEETKDADEGMMPCHFNLMTLMAFYVFLQEKVDVAVIEVGIGGEYDCTNIIRNPWVCGVTTLDIDHTEILGDTLTQIAWQKGGIFKPGVPAFTVSQPDDAMAVLIDRAKERNCPLLVCPELDNHQTPYGPLRVGLAGQHQRTNASLALQLAHSWLQKSWLPDKSSSSPSAKNTGLPQATSFKPSPIMLKALADTEWRGRSQIVKDGAVTYFLDGAHTMRSIQACTDWFMKTSAQLEKNASGPVTRVLLFNTTGERDSASMLKLLVPCHFDFVVFSPNYLDADSSVKSAQLHFVITEEERMNRCFDNERSWHLFSGLRGNNGTQLLIEDRLPPASEQKAETLVLPCILNALQWITQGRESVVADSARRVLPTEPSIMAKGASLSSAAEIHVLITGSLYLVGGALTLIDPAYSQ